MSECLQNIQSQKYRKLLVPLYPVSYLANESRRSNAIFSGEQLCLFGSGAGECSLDWSEINSLLAQTVDHEKFSVEPALGLGTEQFHGTGSAMDAAIETILAKNSTLSKELLQECLEEHYLADVEEGTGGLNQGHRPQSLLQYESPWYLGGAPFIGVPVPDDEEYRPGEEGYSTYLNPHDFENKLKPEHLEDNSTAPFDLMQSLVDILGGLFLGVEEDDEDYDDNSTEHDYGIF
ncbi:hypothetical protein AAG570_009678 [Ranatra chinensis]|uniref:Uncharacterized protein n=1 Tax=Ranatra chinensis TaxID=642074 RepID=A0ABD0Z6X3_9HEMI